MKYQIFKFSFLISFLLLLNSCKSDSSDPEVQPSPYITQVFEYVYGPGQHASLALPSDTAHFTGEPDSKWLYLGGFGGYVVAGFGHDITNHDGPDFEVYALQGAMPEPAVVYVMEDSNGDGKPNDTWYELKGNQFENSKRNYWVKYFKAKDGNSNITWEDSEGAHGELISAYGAANSSGWWWSATTTDSITLYGTRLPDSYENNPVNGTQYWTVPKDRFTWGYAENNYGTDFVSASYSNQLDISNAVDVDGKPVNLTHIRFIKVQTGVFQQAGWTNEVSSEVRGAKELK